MMRPKTVLTPIEHAVARQMLDAMKKCDRPQQVNEVIRVFSNAPSSKTSAKKCLNYLSEKHQAYIAAEGQNILCGAIFYEERRRTEP